MCGKSDAEIAAIEAEQIRLIRRYVDLEWPREQWQARVDARRERQRVWVQHKRLSGRWNVGPRAAAEKRKSA